MPQPAEPNRTHRLQIVILDHTGALGGAELALLRLVRTLDRAETAVRVILFSNGPLSALLHDAGAQVEVLSLGARGTVTRHQAGRTPLHALHNTILTVPFAIRLGRRLRELRPDLIHTNSLKADLLGVPASWIARRPLVWCVHDRISRDYLPPTMVRMVRRLARWVPRQVIANSIATAETLPRVRRLTVAYPGLSPEQAIASPAHRRSPASPVVGMLGRISPTKGQLVFVRAAAQVLETHPEARFRIVGDALFGEQAYADEVRAEVDALGIGEAVAFTGFTTEPQAALDSFTVFVHASPTPEPFGQVVVEAMARGVPVIATEGGGIAEILRPPDGSAPLGLLVPPDRPEALAAAITELLDHPEAAQQRAERAWASVAERFTIATTASVITQVWREVAAGR